MFIKQAEICYGDIELEDYFTNSLFQVSSTNHSQRGSYHTLPCYCRLQQAFVGLEAASLVVLDRDYESGE